MVYLLVISSATLIFHFSFLPTLLLGDSRRAGPSIHCHDFWLVLHIMTFDTGPQLEFPHSLPTGYRDTTGIGEGASGGSPSSTGPSGTCISSRLVDRVLLCCK